MPQTMRLFAWHADPSAVVQAAHTLHQTAPFPAAAACLVSITTPLCPSLQELLPASSQAHPCLVAPFLGPCGQGSARKVGVFMWASAQVFTPSILPSTVAKKPVPTHPRPWQLCSSVRANRV